MECANQLKICAWKHTMCDHVGNEESCPQMKRCGHDSHVPSFAELMRMYEDLAVERHSATGEISECDVRRSLSMMRRFMGNFGFVDGTLVSEMTPKRLEEFSSMLSKDGLNANSVKSSMRFLQRMFARWARKGYGCLGYDVPHFEMPEIMAPTVHFSTPQSDQMTKLKVWYNSLASGKCRSLHIYAMLMYHFGMRNGDVDLLEWNAFSEDKGKVVLSYVPNKTRFKSGRTVRIEVCDVDWFHLKRFRSLHLDKRMVIPGGGKHSGIREHLNIEMRKLGFMDSKGAYTLRKICGDEYARRYGVEMAKNVLGHAMVGGSTKHYVDDSCGIVPTIW